MKKNFIFCLSIFILSCAGTAFAQPMIIETLAGTGGTGSGGDGGPATAATFSSPYGLAVDANDNIYIADWKNNRIRVINSITGKISLLVGAGPGDVDGLVVNARMNEPTGVAVDAAGKVYIADSKNNKIRMFDPLSGILSTIAGNGTPGFSGDGGPAAAALLSNPRAIACDAAGNIFFTDADTMRVREIFAPVTSGNIITVAGVGYPSGFSGDGLAATLAKLNTPRGVVVDATGNLFIADLSNNRIREVTGGIISTIAGIGGFGGYTCDACAANGSKLNGPVGVTMDPLGNVIVSDASNNRIRQVLTSGTFNIYTLAGGAGFGGGYAGDGGLANAAKLNGPVAVRYVSNGSYVISDQGNQVLRIVRPDFKPVFSGGTNQPLTVCENSGATSTNSLLSITDSDLHQTETWSNALGTYPKHGALTFGATASSNPINVTPAGLSYSPTIGYSGLDTFYIKVSDGFLFSIDTIYVTVNPLPVVAAISGPNNVCQSASIVLNDATPGGVWTALNGNAGVVSGTVSGITAGTDVITYTVTNACGPTAVSYAITVNPLPNAGAITGPTFVCMGSTISLTDASPGGVWSSSNTTIATVVPPGTVSAVSPGGPINIIYTVTNGCGTTSTNYPISVIALPNAGSITGPTKVCVLATIIMSDAVAGGIWSGTTGNTNVVGTAVTGVSAGTDIISYSFSNLCGSAYATYNITVNPLPVAGAISGPSGVCVGGTITLSDAIAGVWSSSNTSFATVSGSGVVTGVGSGSLNIINTVSNSCGSASSSYPVNVITVPSAGTITGPVNVCVGATINLSDGVAGGTWTTTNTSASVGSSSGVVTGTSAGIDTINYSVSYSCGSASTTYTVTINPLADAGTITGPSVTCLGSFITLSDVTGSGVWSSSNTAIATVSTGVVSGIALGSAKISYSVTNGCGTVSTVQSVTVSPIVTPKVTFSALPGFNSCIGVPVTYTAIPVTGGASPTFQWSVNGTVSAAGPAFNYTPSNGDIIVCKMTSSAPCVSTVFASDTMKATVIPDVTPAISISTGAYGDTVCTGTPTTYTATTSYGGALPAYQWSVNGIVVAGGNPFVFTPAVTGDNISCTLTSSQACAVPAIAVSNTIIMTVMTSEVPAVNILASPGSKVCQSTTVTFIANTLYGGVPPFIRWTRNGTNVATGRTYNYIPNNGDVIYAMLASASTCLASSVYDSVFSNRVTMAVVPNIPPTVSISGSTAGNVVGIGENDILTAKVTNLTPTTTFQWEVNGVPVPGATTSTFIFAEASTGTAVVNCIVGSGDVCNTIGISNLVNITITNVGVKQIQSAGSNISLVPNPNRGSFSVQGILVAGNGTATLQVMDIMGQVVYKDVATVQNGKLNTQVNMGNELANGIYVLHINSGDTHEIIRFVLSR